MGSGTSLVTHLPCMPTSRPTESHDTAQVAAARPVPRAASWSDSEPLTQTVTADLFKDIRTLHDMYACILRESLATSSLSRRLFHFTSGTTL